LTSFSQSTRRFLSTSIDLNIRYPSTLDDDALLCQQPIPSPKSVTIVLEEKTNTSKPAGLGGNKAVGEKADLAKTIQERKAMAEAAKPYQAYVHDPAARGL
jgi:hypothetical protein